MQVEINVFILWLERKYCRTTKYKIQNTEQLHTVKGTAMQHNTTQHNTTQHLSYTRPQSTDKLLH